MVLPRLREGRTKTQAKQLLLQLLRPSGLSLPRPPWQLEKQQATPLRVATAALPPASAVGKPVQTKLHSLLLQLD